LRFGAEKFRRFAPEILEMRALYHTEECLWRTMRMLGVETLMFG
jgi:hypothetical protein